MPAGVIIGRVAVKVFPNTDQFRAEAKRALNAIEKSLDAIKVDMDLDSSGLTDQARDARKRAQAALNDLTMKVNLDSEDSLKRALDKVKRELDRLGEVDLDVDLNEDSLNAAAKLLRDRLNEIAKITLEVDEGNLESVKRAIAEIDRELGKLNKVKIDVELDDDSLRAMRQELLDNVNRAYEQVRREVNNAMEGIVIRADVDATTAKRALRDIEENVERINALRLTITPEMDDQARRKAEREIEKLEEKIEDIKATISPEVSNLGAAAAAARLAHLARTRLVTLVPVVSSVAAAKAGTALAALSGARVLDKYIGDITRQLKDLDKNIPIIGTLALAIAGLAGSGLAATSNLFTLSASLASIAPAGLALPGILGGIAIGVGTMVAALRDFNVIFPDVQGKFSAMQDLISVNFWERAEKSMRRMLDVILPQLSEGFGKTATSLGDYFAAISDGITGTLSSALGGMFDDLAESISIAAGGADALIGIITTLGTVGAGYLPRLAEWFVKISEQFDTFLSDAAADGRLQGWIDTGIEALKSLGEVISNTSSILASFARAASAAGGSSLGGLADALERIADVVKGEVFQSGLIRILTGAHQAMSAIADVSGPAVSNLFETLAETLGTILPIAGLAIGTLLDMVATALANPVLQTALVGLFLSLYDAIVALEPAFLPLSEALAVLIDIIGTFAETLAPIAAELLPVLAQILVDLAPTIEALIVSLGTGLLNAIELLGPLITDFTGFLEEHDGVAKALAIVIGTTVVAAYTAMGVAATINGLISIGFWQTTASASTASAVTQQASGGKIVGTWVLQSAAAALNGAKVVASWVLTTVAGAAVAVAKTVAAVVIIIARWVAMAAASAVNAAKVVASWVLTTVAGAAVAAASTVAQVAIIVARWVAMAVASALNAAKVVASWLVTSAGAIAAGVVMVAQAALVVAKWVFMATAAMLNGAIIAGAWLLALGPIGIIIAAVVAAAALIIANWDSIKSAFQAGVDAIIRVVTTVGPKIKQEFSNAGSLLLDAGRAIVQGLIDGVLGMLGAAVAAAKRVAGALADAAKSVLKINSPSKVFLGIGMSVGEGLVDGIKSSSRDVKKAMTSLATDVAGTEIESPKMSAIELSEVQAGKSGSSGIRNSVTSATEGGGTTKVFNYYAAPGSGFSSEEELFAATDRSRLVGW